MSSRNAMSWVGFVVVSLFAVACGQPEASSPATMAWADFNGDGRVDLAVAEPGSGTVSVFLSQEDGTLAPQVSFPAEGSAVEARDFDADGFVDLAVTSDADGTVSMLWGHGPGGFSAEATFAE
jgi:hypothetical protein